MSQYFALNKTAHHAHGWRKAPSLSFAAGQSVVAVQLEELPHLIPTLPLAFLPHPANDGVQRFQLVALLSLTPGLNLYLTPDGRWMGGYVPAAFRGHPFRVLPDQRSGRSLLCFDADSGLLTEQPELDGQPFFDADGRLTPPLQAVLKFLRLCEQGRRATQQAVDLLSAQGLIVPWPVRMNQGDTDTTPVSGLYRVDESALRKLAAPALKAMQDGNALALAYAQLLSQHRLSHFGKLYALSAKLQRPDAAPAEQDIDALLGDLDETLKFNF